MRQVISREVAITEAYLDHQAQLYEPSFPQVSSRGCSVGLWVSEIAKALVWLLGLVLLILGMALLAPESRGDTVNVSSVASILDANTVLPLAGGVDTQLASNLLRAQQQTWGKEWLDGSLTLSIESVLRAIGLYVWEGGPTSITSEKDEPIVWLQSHIAIDPRLSVGFDTASINFGEQPVVTTPETGTLGVLLLGLAGLGVLLWITKRDVRELSR